MPPRQPGSSGDAVIRRATPGDADAVARLLHDFQLEFDEPTPGIEALEERYADLIRNRDMTVLLAGHGGAGFAQIRYRPWVYSAGPQAHSYLEELYVVPSGARGSAGRCSRRRWTPLGTRAQAIWSSGRARPTEPLGRSTRASDLRIARAARTDRSCTSTNASSSRTRPP